MSRLAVTKGLASILCIVGGIAKDIALDPPNSEGLIRQRNGNARTRVVIGLMTVCSFEIQFRLRLGLVTDDLPDLLVLHHVLRLS